jgi:hypothetical protein
MLAFLIAGFFNLINRTGANGNAEQINVYWEMFTDDRLHIYGNVFLGIPYLAALLSLVLDAVELAMNKENNGIKYTQIVCIFCLFSFGMMFASFDSNMFPYGMVILGFTLVAIINRIIFHYGFRGQVV